MPVRLPAGARCEALHASWAAAVRVRLVAAPPLLDQLDQLDRLGLSHRMPVVSDLGEAAAALRLSPRLLLAATRLPTTVDAPASAVLPKQAARRA